MDVLLFSNTMARRIRMVAWVRHTSVLPLPGAARVLADVL